MAYSKEKREQALELCQKGFTDDQVSEKLDISKYTLGTWKKLLFETGSLEKKKVKRKSGTPYKYKPEKIKEILDKNKQQSNLTGNSESEKVQKFSKPKKKDKDKSQKSETSTTFKGKSNQDVQKPQKKKKKKKKKY